MYHKYRVYSSELSAENVHFLTLERDEDSSRPLLYQPGQYAAIILNDRSRPTPARCFSITSAPNQQKFIQFSIRVKGLFTSALKRLKKGDEVIVLGPFGNFVFNENTQDDIVMLAGGIGIAPFMSMIRYASFLGLRNKINLVYSCRGEDNIPFFKELCELEKNNSNLKVTYVISSGSAVKLKEPSVFLGRITSANIDEFKFSYSNQVFMICGPSAYMTAIHSLLRQKGVPQKNILTEAFSQGSRLQTDKLASWPFNMYALTGISLIISIIFIMGSDLYKTLPKLNAENTTPQSSKASANQTGGSLLDKLNAIGPQVSTDLKQPPILKYKSVTTNPKSPTPPKTSVVNIPPPIPVVATPKPALKQTVVPKTPPRSTVS